MDSITPPTHPRKAWLALLLGLFLPGLGQIYNGQLNRAAWFMLGFWVFGIPLLGLLVRYFPDEWTASLMLGSIGLALIIWLLGCLVWGLEGWRIFFGFEDLEFFYFWLMTFGIFLVGLLRMDR